MYIWSNLYFRRNDLWLSAFSLTPLTRIIRVKVSCESNLTLTSPVDTG